MDEPAARWRPAAGHDALLARRDLQARIRRFLSERGVLEVDTPLLATTTTTEPALDSLAVDLGRGTAPRWLQPSPERFMKRLLAAGSGPIFQLARAFRAGERGRWHEVEFTLLEWYRPGWDYRALMDEVEALVRDALAPWRVLPPFARVGYLEAWDRALGLDPLTAGETTLREAAAAAGVVPPAPTCDREDLLDLLFATAVIPSLGEGPVLVQDFPLAQSTYARAVVHDGRLAERFELFLGGLEVANGNGELTDPAAQRRRFEADNARRRAAGRAAVAPDEALLAALEAGLPEGSGVALGVDRLLALALGAGSLAPVLAFPQDRS